MGTGNWQLAMVVEGRFPFTVGVKWGCNLVLTQGLFMAPCRLLEWQKMSDALCPYPWAYGV